MSSSHVSYGHTRPCPRGVVCLALFVWVAVAVPTDVEAQAPGRWIGTWATGPVSLPVPEDRSDPESLPPRIADQTLRQVFQRVAVIPGASTRCAVTPASISIPTTPTARPGAVSGGWPTKVLRHAPD